MASFEQGASGLEQAVGATRGHFRYESGHHGDLWLDLEMLFIDTQRMWGWAKALARRAAVCRPDVICGPLTGGAFVAQLLAAETGAAFVFAERLAGAAGPVRYHIPEPLRPILPGKRLLLVDDAVNAGSALLSTLADLRECEIELAGFASLLTLGEAAAQISERHGVPFFTLASLERRMWTPAACPLCASGAPLVDPIAQ
ncbi:MAG: orotate phosphoribosyltransferase [Anaerolineales bacterium]|nr:orotate phosphoribosyltransferase [Anaerolineales bacterium]